MSFSMTFSIFLISTPLVFVGGCFLLSTTEQSVQESYDTEIPDISQDSLPNQISQSVDDVDDSPLTKIKSYQVASVGDGDTIRIIDEGEKITVRLACIDSPELKQSPYGEQAKQRLQSILPINTKVTLKRHTVDRYDRLVSEVFKDDINVNLAMVTEGQAVAYRKYLEHCNAKQYLTAEGSAKSKGLAFWSQLNPVMPWDYRRGDRTQKGDQETEPSPTIESASNCDRSYPDVCIPPGPPDLNCGNIPHRRFRVIGSDPHRLDGDSDGVGCES